MNKIFIIGAGGHSKQVIDIFLSKNISIGGIFDDFKEGYHYRNIKILGKINDLNKLIPKGENLFITFGDNNYRMNLYKKFQDYNFPNCIHINSYISDTAKIGFGNYIGCFAKLGEDCQLGNFNILNEACIVAHDNYIGDYNHLSINVSTGGNVIIGNLNLIGIGASIIPKVIILDNNILGAACLVNQNINFDLKCVGVPIKIVK